MRKTALVVASGIVMGGALLSVLARHRPLRFPLDPAIATALAGTAPHILIKQVPDDVHEPNGDWQHYELSVPPSSPPRDLHISVFTDNKGADICSETPTPWPQPIPIKFQINTDNDQRVKTNLEAQGLSVKKRLVTYHLAVGAIGGTIGWDQTLSFTHAPTGFGSVRAITQNRTAAIGERVILHDMVVPDSEFHGDLRRWQSGNMLSRLHPGQAHRFTVCVQMTPHHGPKPPCFQTVSRMATR